MRSFTSASDALLLILFYFGQQVDSLVVFVGVVSELVWG